MNVINAGEYKHPVHIQRYVAEVDEDGIPTEEWETILKTKAKIKNMSGYEKIIANAETGCDKKRFYIRYKKGLNLTNKDRIVYNDRYFNITYASDVEELHRQIEIVGELVE